MATLKLINKFGKMGGWNDVKVNIFGRNLEGITELEYDDEQELENVMGAGEYPIGQSDGNYSAKGSLTLYMEEMRALLDSLPANLRLQQIPPFDIIVKYEYGAKIYTDRIRNCKFKNNGLAIKQGDKTVSKKFELLCTHIDWNTI